VHIGRIVLIRRPAMDHVARPDLVQQFLWIAGMRRVFHGIEVVEITEELIEAVDGGQEFILVAKMVLAELPGSVTLRFERGGNRAGLSWDAGLGTGLANRGHARSDR